MQDLTFEIKIEMKEIARLLREKERSLLPKEIKFWLPEGLKHTENLLFKGFLVYQVDQNPFKIVPNFTIRYNFSNKRIYFTNSSFLGTYSVTTLAKLLTHEDKHVREISKLINLEQPALTEHFQQHEYFRDYEEFVKELNLTYPGLTLEREKARYYLSTTYNSEQSVDTNVRITYKNFSVQATVDLDSPKGQVLQQFNTSFQQFVKIIEKYLIKDIFFEFNFPIQIALNEGDFVRNIKKLPDFQGIPVRIVVRSSILAADSLEFKVYTDFAFSNIQIQPTAFFEKDSFLKNNTLVVQNYDLLKVIDKKLNQQRSSLQKTCILSFVEYQLKMLGKKINFKEGTFTTALKQALKLL